MSKRILLVGLLSISFACLNAQITYGPQIGINFSSMRPNYTNADEEPSEVMMKLGYNIGIVSDYKISEKFLAKTGLLLSNRGGKFEGESIGLKYENTTSLTYLDIPINLAYSYDNFQFFAGPTVSFGLFGKSIITTTDPITGEEVEQKQTIGFVNKNKSGKDYSSDIQAKFFDLGVNIGAGYLFGPILTSIQYNLGLINTRPPYEGYSSIPDDYNDDIKLKNGTISLSVAYKF